jgi:Methylamine utilisation protein MauE
MEYLSVACRCLTGLVFVASAVGKLRGGAAFNEFVRTTRILLGTALQVRGIDKATIRFVAVAIITAEVAIPVLLVVPATARIGLGLAMLLLLGFGIGIAAAVRKGVRTSCRCFGASSTPLKTWHLIRNAVLLLVAGTGVLLGHDSLRGVDPAGLAIAGGAAAILAALVVRADDLIELFTYPSTLAGRPTRRG